MSLVGNIAGMGILPVPLLTLAHSSVTIGVGRAYAKWPFFGKHRENGWQETHANSFERATHLRSNYDPIPPPPNPHFRRAQGMYTCIQETGSGFSGMCATGISLLLSCDHPLS